MSHAGITDKIGYTLLKKGIIDYETLEKSLKVKESEQGKNRRNLGQILVEEFQADHDTVFREVAGIYAFREIRLGEEETDQGRIEFIKRFVEALPDQARTLLLQIKMLPYKFDDRQAEKLIIIAADPTNRAIPLVAHNFGVKKYEVAFCRLKDLQGLIDQVVPATNEFLRMLEDTNEEKIELKEDEAGVDEDALEAEISRSALINLLEGCLIEAVRQGVSDIHIIPRDVRTTEFWFRVDGDLKLWHVQESTMPEAVAAVVKDRSKNVDRFEREMSQDGFMQRSVDNHMIRFRVSIMPIVGIEFRHKFESIVIRILDDRKVITDLEKLGLQGPAKEFFHKAIVKPQGIIILTGPTGCGKSTTLIAALHQVIDPTLNVLTVEEPVEYIIRGARQLRINPKLDFELALRGILRHDPDIVLVGEMRDRATAEMAIKLANTGHLTFSTLHTNDAPSAVARLYKMGIEPFLIAYAINLIVAQRLIRMLCPVCKRPLEKEEFDEELYFQFGLTPEDIANNTIYEAVGCEKCSGGYKGRVAIHEALYFTKDIRKLIVKASTDVDEEKIRLQATKDGMWTLRRAGINRILAGETTLEEVASATTDD
jgi:type IV pilus assembly protein PilB